MTLRGLKWLTIREWHEQHSQFLQWSLICSDARRFLSGLLSEILIKSLSLIGNIDKSFVDIYFLKLGLFSMKTEQNNNCFSKSFHYYIHISWPLYWGVSKWDHLSQAYSEQVLSDTLLYYISLQKDWFKVFDMYKGPKGFWKRTFLNNKELRILSNFQIQVLFFLLLQITQLSTQLNGGFSVGFIFPAEVRLHTTASACSYDHQRDLNLNWHILHWVYHPLSFYKILW